MSYQIMPPGSYHFWRIGSMSPIVRWILTIGSCLALILAWYLFTTHFFFKNKIDKTWCSQCAAQLAELAVTDGVVQAMEASATAVSGNCSLELLQLCERQHLTVQSCSSQKPTTKNNLTLQRINLVTSGTLTQLSAFLTALGTSPLLVAQLEAHLVQQHNKLYSVTFSFDCIIT
jgi:hypothetical protein